MSSKTKDADPVVDSASEPGGDSELSSDASQAEDSAPASAGTDGETAEATAPVDNEVIQAPSSASPGEPKPGGAVEATGGGQFALVTIEDFSRRAKQLIGDASEAGKSAGRRLPKPPTADASKADLKPRVLARLIDTVIFALLAESITFVGPLVALVYLLLGDGIFDGASVGKKLMKLHVERNRDQQPVSIFDSLLRNAPLGIAGLFVLIPLIGWALFLTLGLAIVLFEGYLVWQDPKGVRAGDILAGTQVRDLHALPAGSEITAMPEDDGRFTPPPVPGMGVEDEADGDEDEADDEG